MWRCLALGGVVVLALASSCGGGGGTSPSPDVADLGRTGGSDAAPDARSWDIDVAVQTDDVRGDGGDLAAPDVLYDKGQVPEASSELLLDVSPDVPMDNSAEVLSDAFESSQDLQDDVSPGEDAAPEELVSCGGMGLTWFQLFPPSEAGTLAVACGDGAGQCDPYVGDTSCNESLPVLCVRFTGQESPTGETPWFPGATGITAPVQGCKLESVAAVDALCADTFGPGWRMAEWHDGSPGATGSMDVIGQWMFFAFGDWSTEGRFWVYINNQIGNCFTLPPANCCDEGTPCPDDGPCVQGYCVYTMPLPEGTCYTDEHCSLGYTCEVGSAAGACKEGGYLDPGACTAIGPGGMCPIFPGKGFGSCTDVLGYKWTGTGCTEVQGCDCGDFCDDIHPSYDECVAACAPPICCTSDADCGDEKYFCRLGFCVIKAPAAGSCWSDGDCGPKQICSGISYCECDGPGKCFPEKPFCKKEKGKPCPLPDTVTPGKCIYAPVCCVSKDDCGPGETCVMSQGGGGTCQPEAKSPECWTSSDCAAGEGCAFVAACPCQLSCISQPGVCAPLPDVCCTSDADCSAGEICSAAPASPTGTPAVEIGQCVPTPAPGACFTSGQCGPEMVCAGAGAWPCGTAGGVPYGTCLPTKGACCATHADCPGGYRCQGLPGYEILSCQPLAGLGECWSNEECPEGNVCHGANFGYTCGTPDNGAVPGTCGPPGEECCTSDADCAEGLACTAKADPGPGDFKDATIGQCVPAPQESSCLHNDDCFPDMVCLGAPGWPCGKPTNSLGWCGYPTDICCTTDAQCPQGTSCVGIQFGATGQCSFPAGPGACWDNSECAPGKVCQGAYACSPCSACIEGKPETPGTCVTPK